MHVVAAVGVTHFTTTLGVICFVFSHIFFATFGISLGYHRYFSHRSYKASPAFEKILAVISVLCFQGGPIYWAAVHRMHHIKTEKKGDAHSAARGFFWSHFGWMLYRRPNGFSYSYAQRYIGDLTNKKFLNAVDRNQLAINFAFLMCLALTSWVFGRLDLFFWMGPIRIVTVWHSTWLINSFSHGAKLSPGLPHGLRNNVIIDFLLGGEGWHKSHHERPGIFSHRANWHFDFGNTCLKLMFILGLAFPNSNRSKTTEKDLSDEVNSEVVEQVQP